MTQPVQEPSQGRQNQSQEFKSRQLFRRPSTGGLQWEDDGSGVSLPAYAWLSRLAIPYQTIPAGTEDFITWEHFVNNDASVFATGATSTSTTTSNTAGDITLILKKGGIYICQMSMRWETTAPDYVHTGFIDGAASAVMLDLHGVTPTTQVDMNFAPDGASTLYVTDAVIVFVDTADVPTYIRVAAENGDSGDRYVREVKFGVAFFPQAIGTTVY